MSKLKNCPLCGAKPILEKFPLPLEEALTGYIWNIYSQCGLQLQGFEDKDILIKKWNTRPIESQLKEAQEAVHKAAYRRFNSQYEADTWLQEFDKRQTELFLQ